MISRASSTVSALKSTIPKLPIVSVLRTSVDNYHTIARRLFQVVEMFRDIRDSSSVELLVNISCQFPRPYSDVGIVDAGKPPLACHSRLNLRIPNPSTTGRQMRKAGNAMRRKSPPPVLPGSRTPEM